MLKLFEYTVYSYKREYIKNEYGDIEIRYLKESDFSKWKMWARKIWYFTPWWFRVYLYRVLFGLLIFFILCKADYGLGFWFSCLWSCILWFLSWIPWMFSWMFSWFDWSLIFGSPSDQSVSNYLYEHNDTKLEL